VDAEDTVEKDFYAFLEEQSFLLPSLSFAREGCPSPRPINGYAACVAVRFRSFDLLTLLRNRSCSAAVAVNGSPFFSVAGELAPRRSSLFFMIVSGV